MTKIDPYKSQERYLKWKEETKKGIPNISPFNSSLIIRYLNDMERGVNVASGQKKGARSYIRLNTLKVRLLLLCRKFEALYGLKRIIDVSEDQLCNFFIDMRNGTIKRKDGKTYTSVKDYVKSFKAFWHWYQRVSRKEGKNVLDITLDLDTSGEKPKWVYLTEEQVKKLCDNAKYKYKILMMFLFDTGIRPPTELLNIKVSDVYNNCKELHIREEISKTFGRRIKLMLCSGLLKEYIKNLGPNDYLFKICPAVANRYLKRLAKKVLGDSISQAGQSYSDLTMYDFRHISCCYWLPRYNSEAALKYRFGWKKSDKIYYYSEMLGMADTICEDNMLIDTTKTEIENRMGKVEQERDLLKEKVNIIEQQLCKIQELTNALYEKLA